MRRAVHGRRLGLVLHGVHGVQRVHGGARQVCDRWLSNGGEQDVCGAEPALRWSAHLLSLTVPLFDEREAVRGGGEWTFAVRQRVWRAVYCNTRGFLLDF